MKKYLFLLWIVVMGGVGWTEEAATPKPVSSGKPNIIFLLSDDLGHDILHCFGSDQYQTPQLDARAAVS